MNPEEFKTWLSKKIVLSDNNGLTESMLEENDCIKQSIKFVDDYVKSQKREPVNEDIPF